MPRTRKTPEPKPEPNNLILELKGLLSSLTQEEKIALLGLDSLPVENTTSTPAARSKKTNIPLGPRNNEFEKSKDFTSLKGESKIDKLLWNGRKPTERKQRTTLINSTCAKCGKQEMVSAALASKKDDTKQIEHVCQQCLNKK